MAAETWPYWILVPSRHVHLMCVAAVSQLVCICYISSKIYVHRMFIEIACNSVIPVNLFQWEEMWTLKVNLYAFNHKWFCLVLFLMLLQRFLHFWCVFVLVLLFPRINSKGKKVSKPISFPDCSFLEELPDVSKWNKNIRTRGMLRNLNFMASLSAQQETLVMLLSALQ